jgi:hypothetical protein
MSDDDFLHGTAAALIFNKLFYLRALTGFDLGTPRQ